jgi:hypothetical protein
LKRIFTVLAVAALMAAMLVATAAAPAFAKVIGPPPPTGGPPAETGNFPSGATVTHCNSPGIPVSGGEGSFVFNKNGIQGQGNCLE